MQTLVTEPDIMTVLKSGTAQQHHGVEQIMPFFHDPFTLADYTRAVAAFLGFFEPVERLLNDSADWSALDLDLSQRRRAHLLHSDLRALGLTEDAIAQLPRCSELPALGEPAHALGCMYVLEGSTLGGQMIGRELARRFAIGETSGASFFLSHGSNVGEMWREFGGAVRRYAVSPARQQQALAAAQETFTALENWFRKVRSHA